MIFSCALLFFLLLTSPAEVQGNPFARRLPKMSTLSVRVPPRKASPTMIPTKQSNRFETSVTTRRGGACQDSDMALYVKVGTAALVEAAVMLGAVKLGNFLTKKFPSIPKLPGGESVLDLLSALAVTFGSSLFGALAEGGLSVATQQLFDPNTTPGDPEWYSSLKKPWWNPPGWLFPIMWLLIVKPTQTWAITRVLKVSQKFPWLPLGAFTGHLALGDAWNKVFFGMQCTGRGAAVISVFYGALLASMRFFFKVDSLAGKLLFPSFGWISVATSLNWSIFLLNRNVKKT